MFGFGGVFAVYSYLASMTTEVMGLGESSVTLVLALFGIGMTLGVLVAGPLTDRALRPTLYGSLAALAVVLVAFRFTVQVQWAALVTVVVLGAVGFMTTTPLQMLVMQQGQGRADTRRRLQPLGLQPRQRGRRVARRRGDRGGLGLDVADAGGRRARGRSASRSR